MNVRAGDGSSPLSEAKGHARSAELVPLLEGAGARVDFVKQLRKDVKKALRKDKRKAWFPLLEDGPADAPDASQYGGQPLLTQAHPRPLGADGQPLPLLLQLDLREHPDEALRADALLQVFFEPGTTHHGLARVIPRGEHLPDEGPALLPTRRITGVTKAKSDVPGRADDPARRTDVELSEDARVTLRDLCWGGDKLSGWPDWIQDAVYPERDGRALTRLVVQVLGGGNSPANLGDAGIGYVFADPDDVTRVAFLTQSL